MTATLIALALSFVPSLWFAGHLLIRENEHLDREDA